MTRPRVAFAGDRDISVWVLKYLLEQGVKPLTLCVSGKERASHANALISLCPHLSPEGVLMGSAFSKGAGLELLRSLDIDYLIGIHFPYIIPATVLKLPRIGVLNLHPAYLPYNRGWHTPSWALLDATPIGATLHFMDTGIDTGDIIHQKLLIPSPGDTAHKLYSRLKQLEVEVFQEAWPRIESGTYLRTPQERNAGTFHHREELFAENIQRLDLDAEAKPGDVIRKLRALTTSRLDEACYYEVDGRRFRVQVTITEE